MTTTVITSPTSVEHTSDTRLTQAAQRLYCAECALEDARDTGVDEWIAAAGDRLHDAVCDYLRAAAR